MTVPSRTLLAGAMIFLAAPLAMAQYTAAAVAALNGDDAGIVVGQPVYAVEKTSETTPLADGTKLTKTWEVRKWRDAQGRFRKEKALLQDGQDPVFTVATILDPVKNTVTTLHLDTKAAIIVHVPQGTMHPYSDRDDENILTHPGVKVKVERLDGKTIDGVFVLGRRETRTRPPGTRDNDKTIVSVNERWVAPDLKMLIAASTDDPRQQLKRDVTHLERGNPEASLFEVPEGYTVKETQGGPLHQVVMDR